MKDLFGNLQGEWAALFIINIILILVLFIMNIINRKKINKMIKKYNALMNGFESKNIESLIIDCIDKVGEVKSKSKEFENKLNYLERNLVKCIQKIGIVRFSAFENVGSDLSFAIALLDNYDTGVVINGIYSRDSSTTYAKAVIDGKSKYPLSAEEIQAIDIAKKLHKERQYTEN